MSLELTFLPVSGQIPPLANVAAMTLPESQLLSVEQVCHEKEGISCDPLLLC